MDIYVNFVFLCWCCSESDGGNARSYGEDSSDEAIRVTRSIMIINPPGYQNGSPPVSPAGSTPPVSPFSGKQLLQPSDYSIFSKRNVINYRCRVII